MLPVVKVLAIWIISILLIPYIPFSVEVFWLILILTSLVLLCTFFKVFSLNKLTENILIFIVVFSVVKLVCLNTVETDLSRFYKQQHEVLIKVSNRYKTYETTQKYVVELKALKGDSIIGINKNCLLIQRLDSNTKLFYPGDQFWCNVYLTKIKSAKHEALFDASEYWALKGIQENLWLELGSVRKIKPECNWLVFIRKKQIEWIELLHSQDISEDAKQIISALILGDKRGVSKTISNSFANLGLVHTLALSGMHISLIYGLFAFFLNILLRHKPKLQSVILVFIIVAYAFLTGLSPSVLRSSLMFLLYAFSLAINRRTTGFNIVFLSALILLIYKPNLLFDIGFQLSYSAVLGILYFYKKVGEYIERQNYLKRFIYSLIVVSLAAQLSVGLLSVYYFHSFPISFLWANLLVLPYVSALLFCCLIYFLVLVIGVDMPIMSKLIDVMVRGLLEAISFLEKHSFPPIEVYLSRVELYYFYGLLLLLCFVVIERQFKWFRYVYVYIFIGFIVLKIVDKPIKKELYVNSSKHAVLVSVFKGDEQVVLTDNEDALNYMLGDYSLRNTIDCIDVIPIKGQIQNGFCSANRGFVQYLERTLLVLDNEIVDQNKRNDIDVLLMCKSRADIDVIRKVFTPEIVLLAASLSYKQKQKLKNQWEGLGVETVDLKESVYVEAY